jgi:putative endopeptidase
MTTKKKYRNKKNTTKKCVRYVPFEKKITQQLNNKEDKVIERNKFKILDNLKIIINQDSKISPQNDFYTYINDRWLKNEDLFNLNIKKTQHYITQIDDFRLVQDKVYEQLNNVVLNYISKNDNKISKCMKKFYESNDNLLSEKLAKKYITESITFLDEMRKDKKNLWKLIAELNKNEMYKNEGPFVWNVVTNRKNSKYFISEISPHIFVIKDTSTYYKNNSKAKTQFLNYLHKLFKAAEVNIDNYEDVFSCGQELFKLFEFNKYKNDINNYNIVTSNEALEKYNFDWVTFSKELGYKNVPEKFIVTDLNYLTSCCELLKDNWTTEKWRSWWIWIFIRRIISFTKNLEHIFFDYHAKELQGIDIYNPLVRKILLTSLAFNTTISSEYVKKYNNEEKVNYIKYFIQDLKEVFIRIIQNNDWLLPSTKIAALKKLHTIKFDLVRPTNLFPDPLLDYDNNDIYGNLIKLMAYRTNLYISLDGKKIRNLPSIDWSVVPLKLSSYQCYIVNAMYIPTKNSIYIPLGYIQEPFIDLDNRGIEYNLSNVGFTICHEMSHCLDDTGSKYDHNGNLNDWWKDSDKKKFKKIQDDILKQYTEWTKRDGIKFDPSISLGEDLADISALYICETYLLDFLKNKKNLLPIINNSLNTFHIYFAAQQKQKIKIEAKNSQLLINPHPPNKYRCNIPLSRSHVYRYNYNIKKEDKMWWPNTKPIW